MSANPYNDAAKVILDAACEAINAAADDLAARSMIEAPMEVGDLRASCQYPSNHPDHQATPEHLEATVSYNEIYAAAQHEGIMTYMRGGKEILWVVKHHTTPGTKTKYLEDPLKAMAARYEKVIGLNVEKALAQHFGVHP